MSAEVFGNLDRKVAYTARTRMNESSVSPFDAGP